MAQNRTFSDFSQNRLIFFPCFSGYNSKLIVRSLCRKPHVRENSGSGVTAPNVVKSTYFQRPISREGVEQIQICFDFQKVRSLVFRKFVGQIFAISTPSRRKSSSKFGSQKGPKNGFSIFSRLGKWILFKLCTLLEANTDLIQ